MQMMWEGRNSAGRGIVHVGERRDCWCWIRNQAAFLFGVRSRCGLGSARFLVGVASRCVLHAQLPGLYPPRAQGRGVGIWHLLWAGEPRPEIALLTKAGIHAGSFRNGQGKEAGTA